MGGSKRKAPEQPTTTVNLGQFGSATSDKNGSTWTGSNFQNQFASNAANQALQYQNLIGNPELSENRINDLNRTTNTNFQNNLLNPALSKGLLRGSTAQDIYSVGQQNYANAYQQALDAEEARNYQRLSTALNNYNNIYNMALGLLGASQKDNQAASQYALQKAQLDAANSGSSKGSNIFTGAANGAMAGSALGPWGALGGAVIGGAAGAMQ